jgi:hypothetical protein
MGEDGLPELVGQARIFRKDRACGNQELAFSKVHFRL